jgi:hypothetical protein
MTILVSGRAPCQTRADAMTTLNCTSTVADPTLDETFERALAKAREGRPEPLTHLICDEGRAVGDVFERTDPCDPARVVSRAHAPRYAGLPR